MKYIGGEIEYKNSYDYSENVYSEIIKNNYIMYSTGRTAIKYVLQSLKSLCPVLLPSYMCDSITQPFDELNIPYQFYRINKDLTIDIKFLKDLLSENKYSALFFINFFGFTHSHTQLREIKSLYKDLVLLEDCTHSTFIPNMVLNTEYVGDIVFGSLRKTLPLSDGAFLLNNNKYDFNCPKESDNDFSKQKHHGKALRKIFLNGVSNSQIEDIYIELLSSAEEKISKATPDTTISSTASSMLNKLDLTSIFHQRQKNYRELYIKFNEDDQMKRIGYCLKEIKDFEMPYMLPFFVFNNKRNQIRRMLRENGVFASVIWGSMPEVDKNIFKETYEFGNHILCFPVDQRYTIEDMSTIYLTFKKVINTDV